MALPLLKLVVNATTDTSTEVNPLVRQYFYEFSQDHLINDAAVVPASAFVDDEGNPVSGNLPVVTQNEGYYLLFINGVLQQYMLYQLGNNGSEFIINDASDILVGSPITLIVTKFDPESISNTSTLT